MHNQGIFFDTAAKTMLTTAFALTGIMPGHGGTNSLHSFTMETWIRFNWTTAGALTTGALVAQGNWGVTV